MRFYYIKETYIDYLKSIDCKVSDNKSETRPYIGIVIEIESIKYYAPLTSPKPKHRKMKNSKDFRKINGGMYGAINLNNMIPVHDSELIEFDIQSIDDLKYRRLLQNQYKCIAADWNNITKSAMSLRNLFVTDENDLTDHDKAIKARCCNLKLLEEKYTDFKRLSGNSR